MEEKQIVAAAFFASLLQVRLKFCGTFIGEYLMQSFANLVHVVHQHGVFGVAARLEVHIYAVFGQGACHQFTVG